MKVVFAGSSIYGASIDVSGIDLRPPATNGDLLRATLEGATVIGLVDGTFGSLASVWHKEILYALQEGVTVLGGGSMGALRAAECAIFGMVPVGRIAEAYVNGDVDDDAWVTLAHAPAEVGSFPMSEPLVDFEATVENLRRLELLTPGEARQVSDQGRAMPFADRTINAAAMACFSHMRAAEIAALYEAHRVSIKTDDAAEVIRRVQQLPDQRAIQKRNWQLAETPIWRNLMQEISSQVEASIAQ